jgi:hypothetical protein
LSLELSDAGMADPDRSYRALVDQARERRERVFDFSFGVEDYVW